MLPSTIQPLLPGTIDPPCPSPTTTINPTYKYTCPYSKHKEGRNLVVCIDGSSNRFGLRNTNVVELYSQLIKSDQDQLTYYNSGVGTHARPSWRSLTYLHYWLSNKVDLLIAWNLETVILAAYRWISENYKDGDRIYFFGFSRGAYQARALAGMIHRVGLILPGNNEQIPFAFELYSKIDENASKRKSQRRHAWASELAETFKSTFCRTHVHIHFIGVWDTVSSVGVVRGKTLPSTTDGDHHMCYFRHALALDERRVKFLPEYIHGAKTQGSHSDRIKEVWFAGSHSDLQSGDIPLLWMRKEAVEAGLRMKPTEVVWKMDDLQKRTYESLRSMWWMLEFAPVKRVVYGTRDSHAFGYVL
ncbi:uncharacterized protein F5891DRAFT_963788 [Suillus fuscotomentosus]|uniref:T6SS Phospholipase effector Tle1-like catalytic domain-containing protein n=1 Tax=Suillus fuscotomentosus TaxID=1912939 RepID=A0AAD4HDT2_9AGAM|nr:uncharacterized protein F5891DRAFT_963788 [Suillus fuscotomentosus]KAG1892857.1 hypothetical protein F5891DRAFT_963788 [Suillus fuscotomentosus]